MSFILGTVGLIILIFIALAILLFVLIFAFVAFFPSSADNVTSGSGASMDDINPGDAQYQSNDRLDERFGSQPAGAGVQTTQSNIPLPPLPPLSFPREEESEAFEPATQASKLDFDNFGEESSYETPSHSTNQSYVPEPPSKSYDKSTSANYTRPKSTESADWQSDEFPTSKAMPPPMETVPRIESSAPRMESPNTEAEAAPAVITPVYLGASAPRVVNPRQEFTVRFTAYTEEFKFDVGKSLKELSPRSHFFADVKQCQWVKGTKIKIKCYGTYLDVQPAEDVFIWNGEMNIIEFDARVRDDAPEETTVLKFDAFIDEICVARVRIDLEISLKKASGGESKIEIKPFATAFASYASEDSLRVLDRIAEITRNGVDVFTDCLSIKPGEQWKSKLEEEIRNREMFLLFWSASAKKSEWVTWEWQTALKQKGIDGISPHPLDPVNDALPPDELKMLHFNDPIILVREAFEDDAEDAKTKPGGG